MLKLLLATSALITASAAPALCDCECEKQKCTDKCTDKYGLAVTTNTCDDSSAGKMIICKSTESSKTESSKTESSKTESSKTESSKTTTGSTTSDTCAPTSPNAEQVCCTTCRPPHTYTH